MDIAERLLEEHSKENTLAIRNYIGSDPGRYQELMACFSSREKLLAQRAAWVVAHSFDIHPLLAAPHLAEMLEVLSNPVHPAVLRNGLKVFSLIELPDDLLGPVADLAFRLLEEVQQPAAIRVHAMSILWKICQQEPELTNELKLLLEAHLPYGTAGFQSRAKKILKAIEQSGFAL